jgi:hypothetical protein
VIKIEGDFMMDGLGFIDTGIIFMETGMLSNPAVEATKDPGRPERPFPLRPGSGFDKGLVPGVTPIAIEDEGRPPVTDDDFIFYAANINGMNWNCWNRAHDAFEAEHEFEYSQALNAQVEGDFYGRNSR